MKPYFLTEITTKDNLVFQGAYYKPPTKTDTAILWVHGLTGNFYSDHVLFEQITASGNVAFASFNNRGHDMIAGTKKNNPTTPKGYDYFSCGAGQEQFEDSVLDIDAGVTFLTSRGYKKIILVGHSTGANKACYYVGSTNDARVSGVVLASPMSDRLIEEKSNPNLKETLAKMEKLVKEGKGDELVVGVSFFPMTPKRYVSLFSDTSIEDTFDYDEKHGKLAAFSEIKKPLLVVLSENDEYADRPIMTIKSMFDTRATSKHYTSVIMKNSSHGYDGKEKEFATLLTNWIRKL